MKRKLLFSKLLLLCALIVGGVNCVWADTVTYTFTNKDWSSASGNWSGTSGNAKETKGVQCLKDNTYTVVSPTSLTSISKVVVTYGTAKSTTTASKISIKIGTGDAVEKNLAGGSKTDATLEYTFSPSETGAITMAVTAKGASAYVKSVEVTYNPPVAITGISFSEPKTASVGVGGTVTLTPTILPAGYTETVDWESDAEGVATVNSSGVVTGVSAGTAHITAKSHDNPSTIYDVCTVTVTAAVPVTGISLKSATTLLLGGETEILVPTVSPDNATNKSVIWESSDATTVSVSESGVITAHKLTNGTPVNITATTVDGDFSATCAVTVNPIAVTGVTLNKDAATIKVGEDPETLVATVSPANATNKTVNWSTSDAEVATVDAGVVTAVAAGTATITATTVDGSFTATCTVTVTDGSINLTAGQTISFTSFSGAGGGYNSGAYKETNFTANDNNAYKWYGHYYMSNSGLQLRSSGSDITSPVIKAPYGYQMTLVHSNGVDVYVGEDKQTPVATKTFVLPTNTSVTLKASSGTPVITNITFKALKLNRTITFAKDGAQEVTVDASMTNAATASPTATVTYSSSDETVASVNASGVVTGVKSGTVTITATTAEDDDYAESTASYTLTVNRAATTLAFAASEQTVELADETATFTATATPTDVSRVITYSSDDATVNSSTGAVTLTETGDFVIKANATATDKYLAPSEASYTLHVVDNRVPVVNAATLNLVLTDDDDNNVALNGVIKETTGTVSATYTKAVGFDGTEVVSYTSSDPTVFEIDGTDFVAYKGGTVTVTVTVTSGGKKMFSTVEKEFTVTVSNPSKTATEITIMDDESNEVEDGDVLNLTYGTSITLEVSATTGYDGTIAKVLSNSSIVNVTTEGTTVTITPAAAGSTTLTISAAETANFTAADNIVLTVNVAEISAKTSAPTGFSTITVFTDASLSYDEGMEWTSSATNLGFESSGDKRGVQFNGKGTPTISSSISQNITRVVIVASINGSSSISSVTVGGEEFTTEDELTSGNPNTTLTYTGSGSGEIEININNSNKSLYIKSIEVGSDGPVITANIPESKFGTYCCEYPLNLPADNDDYAAYIVTAVEGTNVTFTKISGEITGGVPFILYGTPGEYNLTTAASSTYAPSGNMLVGTLSPKYITTTDGDYINFGMKSGKFVRAADGVIKANKAYLPVLSSNFTSDARTLNIIFEDGDVPTGVKSIENEQLIIDNTVYNLKGQRVEKPVKGQLYIVNGKKVVVK